MDTTGQAICPPPESPVWLPFVTPERLGEVTSTNALLAERAAEGAPEGTVLIAESQTAGRGRLGRSWLDPAGGSLLCSILFRPEFGPTDWFLALTTVSLAAGAACAEVTGAEVACKWPNDLVSPEGRKLAGVLAEAVAPPRPGERGGLVVGIGLNCNWPPDFPPRDEEGAEIAARATSLDRLVGAPVDNAALAERLLQLVAERWGELSRPASFTAAKGRLLSDYRKACATLGQRVRVELPGSVIEGRAVAVGDDGYLVVATEEGERAVGVGDVIHLRASR